VETTSITPRPKLREFAAHWRVLVAGTLGIASGIVAIPFYTNALFFPELEGEFGWSPADLSLVVLVYNLIWALLMPLAGRLVDRFGARIPALFSGLFLAAGYVVLSFTQGSFPAFMIVMVVAMVLAIGTGPIAFSRAIGLSFDAMRGLALGISLAGSGATAIIAPQLLGPIILEAGWRTGYLTMGIAVAILAVIVFLLMPSGTRSSEAPAEAATPAAPALRLPVARILSDRTFIRLAVAFVCMALAVSGLVIHLYPMMLQAGVSQGTALWVQSSMGIAVVVGRLLSGYLFDRFFAPRVVGSVMVLCALGLAALLFGGPHLALVAAFAVGFGLGAEVDVIAMLVSRYFSMEAFGQIYGFAYGFFTIGLAGSPYLIGLVVSNTEGFVPAVSMSIALLVVAAVIFFTLPAYGQARLAQPAPSERN
jgi:MFS family permease